MHQLSRYVLDQSMNGHHHLFEPGMVRFALARPLAEDPLVDAAVARETEVLIDELETEEDVWLQRDRIARAPLPVQEVLVHLYFDVLYRYMERRGTCLH